MKERRKEGDEVMMKYFDEMVAEQERRKMKKNVETQADSKKKN